jgi:hypothetical protein
MAGRLNKYRQHCYAAEDDSVVPASKVSACAVQNLLLGVSAPSIEASFFTIPIFCLQLLRLTIPDCQPQHCGVLLQQTMHFTVDS